jgi:outer membrane protein OmpA-like peptidoglycan-associated protein
MKKVAKLLVALLLLSFTPNAFAADATPYGPPTAVTTVTATLVPGGGTDINVVWSGGSANGTTITGYQAIPYSGSPSFSTQANVSCSASGSSDSCTVTGLAFSTEYKFKVITLSSGGSVTSGFSNAVTTPTQTQHVTITGVPGSFTYGSPDFQLFATADSGLPITSWSVPITTSICSIDPSGTVHFIAVGTCTVRATQDGVGSAYSSAYAEASITAGTTLSASIGSANSVQSTQATLNGTVPYPGATTTPEFCISTTNTATDTCSLPSGVSIGSYSPSSITSTSSNSVSAVASGLSASTTYYFWLKVSASGATSYKTGTSSFTTTTGPSLSFSGSNAMTVGTAITGTLTASSGSGVYAAWSASSLPTGITFNPGVTANTSSISGTPTTVGTYASLFSVTDSSGLETQLSVSFTVTSAPTNNSNNNSNNSNSNNNNSNSGSTGNSNSGSNSSTNPVEPKEPSNYKYPAVKTTDTLNSGEPEVSGSTTPVEITINDDGTGYVVKGTNWTFTIYSANKIYKSASTGSYGRITLIAGEKLFSQGTGLLANDQADFWLLPRLVWLHSKLISKTGDFSTNFLVAKNTPTGEYVIQARAKTSDETLRTISLPLLILPSDGKYENLPATLIAKTVNSPVKTLFNMKDLPSFANVKLPSSKIRGVDQLSVSGRLVSITPNKQFSGVILVPVTVKGRYTSVERYLSLTVLTPAVTGLTFQTANFNQTLVKWNKVANASSYVVIKNQQKVCETKSNTCSFPGMSGPNSVIQVKTIGSDGVESKFVTANYNYGANAASVVAINFENASTVLTVASIATLQKFMADFRKEGFNFATVIGYTDSNGKDNANQKLSKARADVVVSFLSGKETGFIDSLGKGSSNPVKSNATTEGRSANRRVEILVK